MSRHFPAPGRLFPGLGQCNGMHRPKAHLAGLAVAHVPEQPALCSRRRHLQPKPVTVTIAARLRFSRHANRRQPIDLSHRPLNSMPTIQPTNCYRIVVEHGGIVKTINRGGNQGGFTFQEPGGTLWKSKGTDTLSANILAHHTDIIL